MGKRKERNFDLRLKDEKKEWIRSKSDREKETLTLEQSKKRRDGEEQGPTWISRRQLTSPVVARTPHGKSGQATAQRRLVGLRARTRAPPQGRSTAARSLLGQTRAPARGPTAAPSTTAAVKGGRRRRRPPSPPRARRCLVVHREGEDYGHVPDALLLTGSGEGAPRPSGRHSRRHSAQ